MNISAHTCPLYSAAALESSLGVMLVGPYDVLSGQLKGVPWEKCVLHSRHYYDPPEMVTVLEAVGDSANGFHIGYYRYVEWHNYIACHIAEIKPMHETDIIL